MRKLLLFIFIFQCLSSSGQHPYFYTLNDEDGLPSNEVYQVLQDNFGFIWIGCDAGLYRYDGFNFKSYNHLKQNSRSISNLKLDKDGAIWCQNFTGQIFNVQNDSLNLFYDASEKSKQYPNYTIDNNQNIWVTTDSSIYVFSKNKQLLKSFNNHLFQINNLSKWEAIHAYENYIYLLNAKGTLIKFSEHFTYKEENIPKELSTRSHFFELDKKLYLFSEENPVRKYYVTEINSSKLKPKEILLKSQPNLIYKLSDCKNHWVLGTVNGAYLLNKSFNEIENSTPLFPGNKISNIFKDKEGNYWYTSLQDGIFIIPSMEISVYNKSNSILADNNISAISKTKENQLYVGTYSGEVYQLNPFNHKINLLYKSLENKYRAVRKITEKENELLIARGPFCVESSQEISIPHLNNSRDFFIVNDTIYYTTSERTGYAVRKNGEYEFVLLINKGGKKIAYDSIQHIVYFACTNGLFKLKNGDFSEIKFQNESIFSSDLFFESNKLWIATHTNGIFTYSKNKIKLESAINNLLQDKLIKSFIKFKNHLFIANAQGLNCIDINSHSNKIINAFDGLAYTEINDMEIINENIYLATIKGLVKIPISINAKNNISPKIKISNVFINGKKVISKNLNIYYKDQLKIDFIGTSFRSRGKFNYAYRIINLNEKWYKVSSKSASVNFPSLPPGDYTFEVVALNEDGVRSKNAAKIQLHVEGPYWEKWWFILIIAIVLILIVAIIFMLRIKYIKEKAITKNRALLSQLKALKAQMNPHFMYNTLNSIQDLILQNDIKSTNYYLSRFGTLMRLILKASDSNYISIQEEIEILDLYLQLEKLRFGDEFNYKIDLDIKNEIKLQIPSMIIQPYVENALKHGLLHKKGEKNLSLTIIEHSHFLEVTIQDNGVGRKKSEEINLRQKKQFESFATKATEMRINLLSEYNKKMYTVYIEDLYENETAVGTKVVVNIPI